jgi:hypothetical protein
MTTYTIDGYLFYSLKSANEYSIAKQIEREGKK